MMKKIMFGMLFIITAFTGLSLAAQADVSKDRIQLMKDIGAMMRSGAAPQDVEAQFDKLKNIVLWPVDSIEGTRAESSIWDGDALAPEFIALIDVGADAAAAGDFQKAGRQSCGACHMQFRSPEL